jgi:predicted glycosyltransferase involved in capsule biosynthesis
MILTTITPVWNRLEALRVWVKALHAARTSLTHWTVNHLLFFVGEKAPAELAAYPDLWIIEAPGPTSVSIGHWHNEGARLATSEWIMKLDVDTLPNPRYFEELLPLLGRAAPREWFNGGMLYLNRKCSQLLETKALSERSYKEIVENPGFYSNSYLRPAGTNFICRRQDYLDLGGCDSRFKGYGWEDYFQIFELERYQLQRQPLPGNVTLTNVTWRCRDEISRRKAWELLQKNYWLCLLHKWHPRSPRSLEFMTANRALLLERVRS